MTLADLQALASSDEGREKIRVMVAWMEGYEVLCQNQNFGYPPVLPEDEGLDDEDEPVRLPDYTGDLNACAQFEAGLSGPTERLRYAWNLRSVTNTGWPFTAFASAPHRCIAFIVTKGAECY